LDCSVLCTGIFYVFIWSVYMYSYIWSLTSFYYYVLGICNLFYDKIALGALINQEELMCIVNNIGHGVCASSSEPSYSIRPHRQRLQWLKWSMLMTCSHLSGQEEWSILTFYWFYACMMILCVNISINKYHCEQKLSLYHCLLERDYPNHHVSAH
jgi:hypothetical protein